MCLREWKSRKLFLFHGSCLHPLCSIQSAHEHTHVHTHTPLCTGTGTHTHTHTHTRAHTNPWNMLTRGNMSFNKHKDWDQAEGTHCSSSSTPDHIDITRTCNTYGFSITNSGLSVQVLFQPQLVSPFKGSLCEHIYGEDLGLFV